MPFPSPEAPVISSLFPMVAPSLLPVAAPSLRHVLYPGRPWAGIKLLCGWSPTASMVQPVLSFTGPTRKAKPALDPSEADSHAGCPPHVGLRGQLASLRRALAGGDPRERRIIPPFLSAPSPPTPHCDRARASDRQLGWALPPEDERLTAWEDAEGDIKPNQSCWDGDCNGMQMKTLTPLPPWAKAVPGLDLTGSLQDGVV